ncbi:MAG: bile acid:sodium symporter family protein [Spirochaetales bacterium]|nr:bile acid:sodium symporter family protein [Spirochaetales bacterium]
MESNILTQIFLPLALFIIMLGMGLDLVVDDFKRVVVYPKAAIVGLVSQMLFLPVIAFVLAIIFKLPGELAVGLMILAACPGGATSNLIAHLGKGDVALSLTLTAVTSLITIVTVPLIANYSLLYFMGTEAAAEFPIFKSIIGIIAVTFIPVVIGMVIHKFSPNFSKKMERPIKILSVFFLVFVVGMTLIETRSDILEFVRKAGPPTFLLNIITLGLGALASIVFKLTEAQRRSVTTSTGIQNGVLAIALITSTLGNPEISIPAAIYSIFMFFTSGVLIVKVILKDKRLTMRQMESENINL